jgi:hypothetical protein
MIRVAQHLAILQQAMRVVVTQQRGDDVDG